MREHLFFWSIVPFVLLALPFFVASIVLLLIGTLPIMFWAYCVQPIIDWLEPVPTIVPTIVQEKHPWHPFRE